jgi:hypothetical protein
MHTPEFPARVRLYVTLGVQVVPFVFALSAMASPFQPKAIVLVIPFLLGVVGPVLELAGRPAGRPVTLTGLGLQTLGAIAFVIAVVVSGGDGAQLRASDLLVIAAIVLPVTTLLLWNWKAGARKPAAAPG